jgi:hypothetical protein
MPENLWPDFQTEPPIATVRRLLTGAAEGLAERTKNKITCVVDTMPGSKGKFVHDVALYVPSIGYRYPFFRVVEEGDPYPVRLVGDATVEGLPAQDDTSLKGRLKMLFASDSTKKTVMKLLDLVS